MTTHEELRAIKEQRVKTTLARLKASARGDSEAVFGYRLKEQILDGRKAELMLRLKAEPV